jgi:NADH-quinone oxidoreductase subunit H
LGIILSLAAVILLFSAGTLITILIEPMLNTTDEEGPASNSPKNNIYPVHPDSWLYNAAPAVALASMAAASVVIPIDKSLAGADIGIGLFYFIVIIDYMVLAVALGGWGSNVPESIESCYRIIAQLVAYVVPLGLAVIGPIMMAKSMSTQNIISSQSSLWYIVSQPLGFALYIITGLMQVYRAPFLEPFSNILNNGIISTYGGWRGKLWRISLSGILFIVAAMGAVLFLGGWSGPLLPGFVWMAIKTFAVLILMKWIGQRMKLLSTARMLELSWKILIPAGLLNVLIVGGLILMGVGGK